jgi:hypothetical protein
LTIERGRLARRIFVLDSADSSPSQFGSTAA